MRLRVHVFVRCDYRLSAWCCSSVPYRQILEETYGYHRDLKVQ